MLAFEKRLNQVLDRGDLRVSWKFIAQSVWDLKPKATSLADFPAPPVQGYRDIYNPSKMAEEVGRHTLDDFTNQGGFFIDL